MTNSLKSKVGSGGIDASVIEAAQSNLDQKIADSGKDWLESQIDTLVGLWKKMAPTLQEDASEIRSLVDLAVDVRYLSQTLERNNLGMVARSLHTFAETANPEDPVAVKLIDLHVNGIRALANLGPETGEVEALAKQIVDDLRKAANKVAKN